MKNKVFICLAETILSLTIINPAFSQSADKNLSTDLLSFSKESSPPLSTVRSDYINAISPKAIRHFVKKYDYSSGEKWTKISNGYVAFFEKDSIKFNVSYDTKGYWISTMRTYTEKYLLSAVRHPVKSSHYDFDIYLIREIESDDHPPVYFIYLRKADDETFFKNIIYSDGEMWEVEPYKGKWREKNF